MTADDADLELAAAVAHAVPGAQVTVGSGFGGQLVAGHHPAADLSLCALRRRLVSRRHAGANGGGFVASNAAEPIRLVKVGGVLDPIGGGVFRDMSDSARRWIVSHACAGRTVWALRATSLDGIAEDAISATLRPDRQLGVTVIGLRVEPDSAQHCDGAAIDDLALRLASSLMLAGLAPASLG